MKVCPVCNARCFDDMQMCYGCLHRFDDAAGNGISQPIAAPAFGASCLSEGKTAVLGTPVLSAADAAVGLIRPIGYAEYADECGRAVVPEMIPAVVPEMPEVISEAIPDEAILDLEEPAPVLSPIDDCCEKTPACAIQCDTRTLSAGTEAIASPSANGEGKRKSMLLVVDVGNTQTVLGLFEGRALEKTWRIATDKALTSDGVQLLLASLFAIAPYELDAVGGAALACVVPHLTMAWKHALAMLAGCDPVVCTAANAEGMFDADYPNPQEIGQDRIADAIALRALYGAPSIAVDFGTATNIEIIDKQGRFCGGIIAPGVETSLKALFSNASKLSMVDLDDPGTVIGKSTEQAIQSGIVYGEAERVDGLLRRIFEELGYEPAVVATGGLATLMTQHSRIITATNPDLTLHGLRLLHEHVSESSVDDR